MSTTSRNASTVPASPVHVPHPLVAGVAWVAVLSLLSAVFLAGRLAYARWVLGVEDARFLGGDQVWSLALLLATGMVAGIALATVRRRRAVSG